MNLLESLRVALRGLASNKMRTMLTMLGIIIGVGVVILVVAIGQGASSRVQDTINTLGTNPLTVRNGQTRIRNVAAVNKATSTAAGTTDTTSKPVTAASPNHLKLEDARQIATA